MLGSGTNEQDHPWVGYEYLVERGPALRTLASFGVWRRPFIDVDAPRNMPAAGNFTADGFAPAAWRPHYPNAAFDNLQPEDAFWAARIVAAFTPEAIGEIVRKARFTDPGVEDHVTGVLLRRRALVLRTWLTAVSPIVDARIDSGVFSCDDAAAAAGLGTAPIGHDLAWFAFDNVTGRRRYVGRGGAGAMEVPRALEIEAYIGVDVRAAAQSGRGPARVYFRRTPGGWTTVGIERRADTTGELFAAR
jgi:hypothetical protein